MEERGERSAEEKNTDDENQPLFLLSSLSQTKTKNRSNRAPSASRASWGSPRPSTCGGPSGEEEAAARRGLGPREKAKERKRRWRRKQQRRERPRPLLQQQRQREPKLLPPSLFLLPPQPRSSAQRLSRPARPSAEPPPSPSPPPGSCCESVRAAGSSPGRRRARARSRPSARWRRRPPAACSWSAGSSGTSGRPPREGRSRQPGPWGPRPPRSPRSACCFARLQEARSPR